MSQSSSWFHSPDACPGAVASTSDGASQSSGFDVYFKSEQSLRPLISILEPEAYTPCGWAQGDV